MRNSFIEFFWRFRKEEGASRAEGQTIWEKIFDTLGAR